MVRIAVAYFALFLAVAVASFAQTPDSVSIRGNVLDQSGAAVPGVEIKVVNTLTSAERSVVTDSTGRFLISGLPVGTYTITSMKQGFADANREVTLIGSRTADLELRLNIADKQSEITVTGTVGEIRTDQPQLGDHLGLTQVQELPKLSGRITYLPLVNAANRPALNQGDVFINQNMFTTNGSGRRQTAWVVDGSTGNDSWGRQTIFSTIPQTAIQEMTVLQNAFSAEYGATTGGVVNIVTRSGGNSLHGDILGMWRPNDTSARLSGFTATNIANGNQVISDSLGQLGASISGPIPGTDNNTHFLFAGEYTRQNRGSAVISPVAPGVFVGHYAGWLSFLRLDHQINSNNNLFFRANSDSFHDTNPNGTIGGNTLPTVGRIFRRRTYSAELGWTSAISSSLLNSARGQFQLGSPITQFDPVVFGTQFIVPITAGGTFTSGTSQSALLLNRQYQFSDTLSASKGKHQIKFGADVIHAHNGGNSKEFGGPFLLGQLTYKTCALSLADCESPTYLNNIANLQSYSQSFGNAVYTVDDTLWSMYAQDDIRLHQKLTVNLGLRYEQQTFTDAAKNFAPRVGFSYDPFGRGKTVVRGGYGIYYAQVINNSEANYALSGPTGVFTFSAQAGQLGFPTSIGSVPLAAIPTGANVPVRSLYIRPGRRAFYNQFLDTSVLKNYPDNGLLNPYSQQWTFGIEQQLAKDWVLSVDYLGSRTIHVVRPLDVDAPTSFVRTTQGQTRSAQAANCTRPLWVKFYADAGRTCSTTTANPPQPAFATILTDVNNGFVNYNSLNVNLSHHFTRKFAALASYVYSHAIDNVDPDVPGGNPNDANLTGIQEKASAIFDQRHRLVLSGVYNGPWGFNVGGIGTLASALPFNFVTGTNNSGDAGATTDRPVINGAVVGRNAGRGRAIYDFSPFVEKDFGLRESVHLKARVESFNVFNHANFVGYNGTYGNGAQPATLGIPLTGITNQLPARSMQFSLRLVY